MITNRMKKITILLLLTMLPLLSACDKEYNAERLYWQADRASVNILNDPKQTPSFQYETAIAAFRNIIKKYPDSKKAGEAQLKLGQLYMAWEKFPEAVGEFEKIPQTYRYDIGLKAKAQLSIGKCYEQAGDWSRALAVYRKVFADYQNVSLSIDIPLHIAQYYQNHSQITAADDAFRQAIKDYQKIIKRYPKSQISYICQDYIALCYVNLKDWYAAIKALEKLRADYPSSPKAAQALFSIGTIYDAKLDKRHEAIDSYQKFLKEYRNDNLAGTVKKILETLQETEKINKH
ncbi:MAG: tetratricopeptide repeat protein [Candidatus Firestonebacteria bacterium]